MQALATSPSLAGMRALPQWILWVLTQNPPGKPRKLPINPHTLSPASTVDPATWASFDVAAAAAAKSGLQMGYVFAGDHWFVDLDDCLQADGTWAPWAVQVCQMLPGAAAERSQSGHGLHLFGRGTPPAGHRNRSGVPGLGAELYTTERFVAMTGIELVGDCETVHDLTPLCAWLFPPRPIDTAAAHGDGPRPGYAGPADDDELIRRALLSRSAAAAFDSGGRASFADLWDADAQVLARCYPSTSGQEWDGSSADAALAQHLAFWTGCDHARIERLMRRSALRRDKYEREDYLQRTIAQACARQVDVLVDKPRSLPALIKLSGALVTGETSFLAAAAGEIKPRLEIVIAHLQSVECSVRVKHDEFLDETVIDDGNGMLRPIVDVDRTDLRADFQIRGFQPIPAETMRDAVRSVARRERFDSAKAWAATLAWDGIPRIDNLMSRYYAAADSPYTRAVGAYVMTAAAGRLMQPGCQADMALVLVGLQGARKTSAVCALCPDPSLFVEIGLGRNDDELARQIRGKLIGELAELRGLQGRDAESLKSWISRRVERWRPVYQEQMTTYARRIVFIGTTNKDEFLDDETGERRWLPVRVGAVDVDAIERDRDQLWAEGLQRFRASGVAWQDAERLARAEHAAFKISDEWTECVRLWLADRPNPGLGEPPSDKPRSARPFALIDVATQALSIPKKDVRQSEMNRLSKILTALGYQRRQIWTDTGNRKLWVPV